MWAKFQSVYFPALPRESPENSIKTRGQLGQQKCSRLAAVQHLVANTENSPLHQRGKNEIHEARCTAEPFSQSQGCSASLPGASRVQFCFVVLGEMPSPRVTPGLWGGLHVWGTSEVTPPVTRAGSVSCTSGCALSRCFNVKGIKAGYFQCCAECCAGLFLPYPHSN